MTQQEAYRKLLELIQQMQGIYKEASQIAHEHDLVFESLSYRELDLVTEDPRRLDDAGWIKRYKDDDPEYPGLHVNEVWTTSTDDC